MNFVKKIYIFLERNGFEVCNRIAFLLGIRVKNVRLSFIYASFFLGTGFIFYLFIAFWIKIKDILYEKRSSAFDL